MEPKTKRPRVWMGNALSGLAISFLLPTYVATLLWAGLVLRDDRVQALFVRKGAIQ